MPNWRVCSLQRDATGIFRHPTSELRAEKPSNWLNDFAALTGVWREYDTCRQSALDDQLMWFDTIQDSKRDIESAYRVLVCERLRAADNAMLRMLLTDVGTKLR